MTDEGGTDNGMTDEGGTDNGMTDEGGTDGGDPASKVGCSDATREGFLNQKKYPKIAACGGAWDIPGIHNPLPACDRKAGNTGEIPSGEDCNVTDLCTEGWHVCYGKTDVLNRNPLGCGGIMDGGAQSPAFFLTRTSSSGAFDCAPDAAPEGKTNKNDLFGCGDMGCPTKSQKTLGKCEVANVGCDPLDSCEGCEAGKCEDGSECKPGTCFPLTLGSHNTCMSIKLKANCKCYFLGELPPTDKKFKEGDMENVTCQPGSGGCGWCKPLNYWNKKLGLDLKSTWDCHPSCIDGKCSGTGTECNAQKPCTGGSTTEALNVIKLDPMTQGGVLCCQDGDN
jgi:hypothetical protein